MRAAKTAFSAAGSCSGCTGAVAASASTPVLATASANPKQLVLVDIQHLSAQVEFNAPVMTRRIDMQCPDRNVGKRQHPVRIAAFEFDEEHVGVRHLEL